MVVMGKIIFLDCQEAQKTRIRGDTGILQLNLLIAAPLILITVIPKTHQLFLPFSKLRISHHSLTWPEFYRGIEFIHLGEKTLRFRFS